MLTTSCDLGLSEPWWSTSAEVQASAGHVAKQLGWPHTGNHILGDSFIRSIKNSLMFSLGYSKFRFYTSFKKWLLSWGCSREKKKKKKGFIQQHRENWTLPLTRCSEALCHPCLSAVEQLNCLQDMRENQAFLHPRWHNICHTTYVLLLVLCCLRDNSLGF